MKTKVKKLIAFFLFWLILLLIVVRCTYLFRNTDRNARQNVLGLYNEHRDSIDVMFVGPSQVYRFWNPMEAWKQYGFTSYNYSVSAMSTLTIVAAIEEMEKTQSPKVIAIDIRSFVNRADPTELSASERNFLDSIDLNLNRLLSVKYVTDRMGLSFNESLTEYLDIIQYHDNREALGSKLNWQLADNRLNESIDKEGFYKGFAIADKHDYMVEPDEALTDEGLDHELISDAYTDLLEYCKELDAEVFFVSAPYCVSKDDVMKINAMEEMAREYGFDFVDCNKFYDKMELDFSTDFKDVNHVNIVGANKYTRFLGQYIIENYDVPDHRGEEDYSSWDVIYDAYKKDADAAEMAVWSAIGEKGK